MRIAMRRLCAVVALVVLAGCGGEGVTSNAAESPATETESSPTDPATADAAVEIEVRIVNGSVTPAGGRVDVTVGQTVRFVVASDTADEIHVHSTSEQSFSFPAGVDDREFEFTIEQPGVVEAELHELGDVIVTLAARP